MQNISEIIKKLRKNRSQSDIARLTGISQSKLSRWEAGKIAAGADDALKLLALTRKSTRPTRTTA